MNNKISRLTLTVFVMLLMSSCFDVTEEFTINKNGSGSYSMKMDMFKMVEMLAGMGGKESLENDKSFKEKKDTTVYFKDNITRAEDLTKEEKDLLVNSSARMKMSLSEKEFFMKFDFPVKAIKSFDQVYKLTPEALKYMKVDNNSESGDGMKMQTEGGDAAKTNQFFDIIAGDNYFEKRVKVEELKAYSAKDSSLQQMKAFMKDAKMISVVHAPQPIKKCGHPDALFSEDRKTVTLNFSYLDYLENPEKLNFRIEW